MSATTVAPIDPVVTISIDDQKASAVAVDANKPDISPTSTDRSRPYRARIVDEHDRKYANVLREKFNALPVEKRIVFNKFTKNLMDETHIGRFCLLDAIDAYVAKYGSPETWAWIQFSNDAFNYRPYQCW